MSDVVILIPAAGRATRMRGTDKLLEEVDGVPQLARITQAALATGCDVIVTLAPDQAARRATLPPHDRLGILVVPEAAEGMAGSLRRGVAAAGAAQGLMIVPADMPDLKVSDFQAVMKAFSKNPERPLRGATASGTQGHPVVLPRRVFADVSGLSGDTGARQLLDGQDVGLVVLPGNRAITDLDTPEEWAAWRAQRQDHS